MATSDILGLFVSPEQYQAQQLAQQQAAEQQRAFNFAQLSPRDQAVYGMFLGGQQLARGLGGLLGVQDPQLQRIRQREEIMRSINPADMASLTAGIQRASQMGDQELALSLTDFMNKQGSEIALTKQRETEKVPQDIQIAARIRKLTEDRLKLPENERGPIDAEIQRLQKALRPGAEDKYAQLQDLYVKREEAVAQFGVDSNAVKSIDRLIQSLAPLKGGAGEGDGEGDGAGKGKHKELVIARERARIDERLRVLDSQNMGDSPEAQELRNTKKYLDQAETKATIDDVTRLEGYLTELSTIQTKYGPDTKGFENDPRAKALQMLIDKSTDRKGGKEFESLVVADNIVKLRKQIRDAKDPSAPEVLEAKDRLAVLEQQLRKDKPNLTVVGEVRSGTDKGKTVYVDENKDQQFVYSKNEKGEQVRKLVSDVDVDRMTSQVTATASSSAPGVKAFREKLGGLDAKDVEAARANRDNAIAALNTLNELTRLDQQGVTSGAFAEGRIGAVNLLNTLGLVSNKDAGTLANSQTFSKVSGDLILATLGGKLGAGFSNDDRKFIAGLVPQLETSRKARQQLINFMVNKNQLIIDEAIRLEDYARENDGLKGFRPKIPIVNAPAPGTVRSMTDDELKAAIEKARKGK